MKEYIVTLKPDVDLNQFWQEIELTGNISAQVPYRPVEIANNRDLFPRKCHYYLDDDEASQLKQDQRVAAVERPIEQDGMVKLMPDRVNQARDNFEKTSLSTGSYVNWGLVRNSSLTNVYGTSVSSSTRYGYYLDGDGVDVVIIDSGIQADHPEFDYTGNSTSRVQQIDWFTLSGVSGSMPAGFYTDYSGHGTHVAGIAAGTTYGWAKNAQVFAIKLSGLEGPTDPNSGLTWDQTADVLLGWHTNKMNPSSPYYTGRPTIINCSFGAQANIVNQYPLAGVTYRGVAAVTSDWSDATYGLTFANPPYCPFRVTAIDDDIDTFISNGIICCISAGNDNLKIDVPGGLDYDNLLTFYPTPESFYNLNYMQGASPYSGNAIIVGAMDSTAYSSSTDQKTTYSSAGPGVDIFAAGQDIMSACSSNNQYSGQTYNWDPSYKQVNIGGTSMASPQIAGIVALYLQENANATPSQVKSWVTGNASYTIYKTNDPQQDDYSDDRSQWGGNAPVAFSSSQGPQIKTTANTWTNTANVLVKSTGNSWTQVQNIWTKVDATTWKQIY